MKRVISLLLAIAFLQSAVLLADDGGSLKPEDWTYGNIYVKEPNDKIALERELLVVEQANSGVWDYNKNGEWGFTKKQGSEVTALFDFLNTTKESVTVPCAFPVVVKTCVTVLSDGTLSPYIYSFPGGEADSSVLAIAFGKSKIEDLPKENLFAIDKKLRTVSAKDYLSELSRAGFQDSVIKPCVIEQDGKAVNIQTVGIETSIAIDEERTAYLRDSNDREANEIYTVTLVLHFYHELHFPPNTHSRLSVKYDIDSHKRSYRSTNWEMTYDISTGGTWKGAMKSFVVFSDGEMSAQNTATKFDVTSLSQLATDSRDFNLYSAQNYKPQKNEKLIFKTITDGEDSSWFVGERKSGEQNFVKDIRSSSAYKGTYKIAGRSEYHDEENLDKNLRTSTYEAKTSFDGILFNGWVEGAKGNGSGEWIEFTLTKSALGPFATNGLLRFSGRMNASTSYYTEDKMTVLSKAGNVGSTWKSNNRIKAMRLSSPELKKDITLNFVDLFPASENTVSANWISVNAVENPLLLKKGTYKMTIDSVYKGNKYDDTALGEVWFIPLCDSAEKILSSDADSDGFFSTPLNKIIQSYVKTTTTKLMGFQRDYEASIKDDDYWK